MAKKQFSSILAATTRLNIGCDAIDINVVKSPPARTVVEFGESTVSLRQFDFSEYYGQGCDEVVFACQQVIERMVGASIKTLGQTLSMTSVINYCNRGLKTFLPFCAIWARVLQRDLTLNDVDRDLIQQFIRYLASSNRSVISQRNNYTFTKSVLMDLSFHSLLAREIFPRNPYPKINRQKKGEQALTKREREKVIKALGAELRRIAEGKDAMTLYELSICALGIAARTGMNPTPLLELPVDCIQPHPLKASHRLLISFKRRGKNTYIQSIRKSEDVELFMPIKATQVCGIVELVVRRNAANRQASKYPYFLFVGGSRAGSTSGENRRLKQRQLGLAADELVKKYKLIDDDGTPISLNVMRLRKTFANRIWELSGQDPIVSAAILGHGIKVQNDHYLEAPPEAEKNWRFMGEILVDSLLETGKAAEILKENTPIAGCSDNLNGDRAPKNGNYCTNFLNCFICKNFVVTSDDLYRVYSFYWLMVRERERIGARRWSRYYAHVIRIIDNQLAPQFGVEEVAQARLKAQADPHPFWRDPQILEFGE